MVTKISIIGTGRHSKILQKLCKKIDGVYLDYLFSRNKKKIKGSKVTNLYEDILQSNVIFMGIFTCKLLKILVFVYKRKLPLDTKGCKTESLRL